MEGEFIMRMLLLSALLSTTVLACEDDKGAATGGTTAPAAGTGAQAAAQATGAAAAAGGASCDAVVAKFVAHSTGPAGEPEKKLWRAMCEKMPASGRTCIAGSKSNADLDACLKALDEKK